MADRTTRTAALWATAVAVPLALVVAFVALNLLIPEPDEQSDAPVEMAAPALTADATLACRALTSQLPAAVRDREKRAVTAGPEQNAAYGDPAITVACGGEQPSFLATDLVYPMDQVCWHAAETAEGSVWTTVDRVVPVRVTIPAGYDSPGQWANEFSATVLSTIRSIDDKPAGCGG